MTETELPLEAYVRTHAFSADEIAIRVARIRQMVLDDGRYLDGANFTRIHPQALQLLFDEYDRLFFAGRLQAALGSKIPLHFGLSQRMTSSCGKTLGMRSSKHG